MIELLDENQILIEVPTSGDFSPADKSIELLIIFIILPPI